MSEVTISCQELKSRLDSQDDMTLLDIRAQWEFDTCHIPGSIQLPLTQLADRIAEVPRDKPIIAICHHGVRSLQALRVLKECGFEDVKSLSGGVHAWAQQIDPEMETY